MIDASRGMNLLVAGLYTPFSNHRNCHHGDRVSDEYLRSRVILIAFPFFSKAAIEMVPSDASLEATLQFVNLCMCMRLLR